MGALLANALVVFLSKNLLFRGLSNGIGSDSVRVGKRRLCRQAISVAGILLPVAVYKKNLLAKDIELMG